MATSDVNNGNAILTLAGTGIATTYAEPGTGYPMGAAAATGVRLFVGITLVGGSSVTTVTVAADVSNDDGSTWAPILLTLHSGAGSTNTDVAITVSAGTTTAWLVTVSPLHVGGTRLLRVKAKANAAGSAGDSVSVTATAW